MLLSVTLCSLKRCPVVSVVVLSAINFIVASTDVDVPELVSSVHFITLRTGWSCTQSQLEVLLKVVSEKNTLSSSLTLEFAVKSILTIQLHCFHFS